ncbi:MAG: tRNA (adenosine(37)-N6)-threonylcarbamoyltransferase complex ATPase subunit type 1 TsaE [Bacilli bacterium]|jgi:tRNA threonylcarbamoyladenosine biosynthesis protein TsaE|nr:tRNA (adenosine(37)-N6)-threonylcarbamoyltransferase complex ATPase subunit type 1 TsaE [Bacilli bacterium]
MQQLQLKISNLMDMEKFAHTLAKYFNDEGAVIFLDGDLGAGKTTFTQYFAEGLGVKDVVTSPTFNIFKRYKGKKHYLNHFDLYRIQSNVYNQGFEEYWYSDDITIIEWANYLPNEFRSMFSLQLSLDSVSEDVKIINVLGKNSIISYIKEYGHEFVR